MPEDLSQLPGVLERISAVVLRLPAPGQLSLATAATLNTLARYGPVRLTDLANSEAVSQPGMSQLVARLERAGLAERRTDPHDGRVVQVAVTPAGEDLLARRRAARATQLDELLTELTEQDRERLRSAVPALGRLAEQGELARSGRLGAVGTPA